MKHLFIVKFTIFFHALFAISSSWAAKIVPLDTLPLEFQFLIEGLQETKLTKNEEKKFLDIIKELDLNFKILPKKHLFFITKSEIHKGILNNAVEGSTGQYKIDAKSISLLNAKLSSNFQHYNSFSRWLIESLQSDIWELSSLSAFHSTTSSAKGFHQDVKIQKKIKILLPWYELILHTEPAIFNEKLKPILINILDNILLNTKILIQFSKLKHIPNEQKLIGYDFFTNQEINEKSPSNEQKNKNGEEDDDDLYQYQERKKSEAERIINELNVPTPLPEKGESPRKENEWLPISDDEDLKKAPLPSPSVVGPVSTPIPVPSPKSTIEEWRPR